MQLIINERIYDLVEYDYPFYIKLMIPGDDYFLDFKGNHAQIDRCEYKSIKINEKYYIPRRSYDKESI